jgi:hypothetical protein
MRIAKAAIAVAGQNEFLSERGEIVDQRFAILVEPGTLYLRGSVQLWRISCRLSN